MYRINVFYRVVFFLSARYIDVWLASCGGFASFGIGSGHAQFSESSAQFGMSCSFERVACL